MAKRDYTEMATRLVVAAIGKQNRSRRLAIFAVVFVALVGGAVALAIHGVSAGQQAALDHDWAGLQACLLGDPLKEGETAASRFTAVQLGVLAIPAEQRSKPNEPPWPAKCATLATSMAEHAMGAEQGAAEIEADAKALGKVLRDDMSAALDVRKEVGKVWEDAARAQLKTPPDASSPAQAPKPVALRFASKEFRDLPQVLGADFALSAIQPEAVPSGDVRFLIDDKQLGGSPVMCTTNANRDMLDCDRVPVQVAKLPTPRLLATVEDRASPLYFCGDKGSSGVFWPDGRAVIGGGSQVYGAVSRADGSAALLARKEGQGNLATIVAPANGAATEQPALLASDVDAPEDATILWDWMVWRTSAKATPAHHLMARKVRDFAPPADLGEVPTMPRDPKANVTACRAEDALAVRVRGIDLDAMTFLSGGRWSAPRTFVTHGGSLTCHAHEALVTALNAASDGRGFATIDQSRCDLSGCTTARVEMRDLLGATPALVPDDASKMAAADVDGRLAIAWSAGAVGGLRVRVAPVERIKTTADVVVFDGRDEGNTSPVGMVTELRFVPASTYAVLFVNTTAGARALRVTADGKISALHIAARR